MEYLSHFSTEMTVCLRKIISQENGIMNTPAFKRSKWG